MSVASSVSRLLPSIENKGNFIRSSWDRLAGLPGGSRIFSRLVGFAAPYTGSIGAHVVELREGYSRVELDDRPKVRNHLRSIHAIALANLAELTGNVAVAYSLPDDARFIVAGMSMEYLKKARGTLTAESHCPHFSNNEKQEIEVEVSIRDRKGEEVARSVLRTLIGPKKR